MYVPAGGGICTRHAQVAQKAALFLRARESWAAVRQASARAGYRALVVFFN
jgi:hypothetical protein